MSGWMLAIRNKARLLALVPLLTGCYGCSTPAISANASGLFSMRLPLTSGSEVDMASFRGQVLMLDLFHTWSQASMLSIPGYAALYRKYHEKGLNCVGIAMDEIGMKIAQPFAEGLALPYPVAVADDWIRSGQSPLGEVSVTPVLMLFDREGSLRKVFVGHVALGQVEAVVQELLR
jgi:peroxiredoxin